MDCAACGNQLIRVKKYCNKACQRAYEAEKIDATCTACAKVFKVGRGSAAKAKFKGACRACVSASTPPPSPSGPLSPVWKGGHRYWSPGRHGKDKDGLSWKVQRKLAWERDDYTCQHCHTKSNRNPDIHHIEPWMNSRSHALDNLISLCQKCHLTEEAKVQAVWGGQLLKPKLIERDPAAQCATCGHKKRKLNSHSQCNYCHLRTVIPEAKALLAQGIVHAEVAKLVGVGRTALYYWLKNKVPVKRGDNL